jgi:lysophospholipase L1-like esterase
MKSLHRSLPLLLIVVAVSPVAAFAHSAVEPASRNEPGWKDRQELLNKRAAEAGEKAQVIFIGDSITQGWEGAGKEVWTRYYAPRNAVNLGIGGDRTQHVLWRFDNGNLNGLKPKAAVVMIGTNNSNGEDNTVDQIADGITAIVRKLREKLPQTKVLLLAIFPRSENPSAQRGKVLQVNQIIQKLADDQNVFWVDFGYKFVNGDGTIPRELMPDYLHLSPKGYEIWAEAIEDKLAAILGDARVKADKPAAGVSPARSGTGLTGEWTWSLVFGIWCSVLSPLAQSPSIAYQFRLVSRSVILTSAPPWRLLSSAASMKAKISIVSSGATGAAPVRRNFITSATSGR